MSSDRDGHLTQMLMYNVCRSLSQIGGSKKTKYRLPKVASHLQPFSLVFAKFKVLDFFILLLLLISTSKSLKGSSLPPKHLVYYISLEMPPTKSQKQSLSHLNQNFISHLKICRDLEQARLSQNPKAVEVSSVNYKKGLSKKFPCLSISSRELFPESCFL